LNRSRLERKYQLAFNGNLQGFGFADHAGAVELHEEVELLGFGAGDLAFALAF